MWAVRLSDDQFLRTTTETFTPAIRVTFELQPGADDISGAIIDAGGVVTRAYHAVPALTAFVPSAKIPELQRLPGVKKLRKSRPALPAGTAHE